MITVLWFQLMVDYFTKTYNKFMQGADTFESEDAEYHDHLSKFDLCSYFYSYAEFSVSYNNRIQVNCIK